MAEHCYAECCLRWVSHVSPLSCVSLCWMSFCCVSLLWVSWRPLLQSQWIKGEKLSYIFNNLFPSETWHSDCQCVQKLEKSFNLPYFIEYNAHTSIMCTWFLAKKLFLFFKNNFTRIYHCKFIHHKSHLKPFLSYLPCMVRREYFSIIFNV